MRIRTTSESSAVSSTTRATTHHHRCDLHPGGLQRGTQCPLPHGADLAAASKGGGGGGGSKGNVNHVDLLESGPRSRAGSKGIRDFLRLVTRSSADDGDRKSANSEKWRQDGCHGDGCHGGHVMVPPSRLSLLRDSMRQRSRSDAGSIQRPPRKRSPYAVPATAEGELENGTGGCQCDAPPPGCRGCDPKSPRHHHEANSGLEAALTTLRVSGFPISNGDPVNPIHSPLSPLGRVKTPTHIGPAEFIELYRHRAHSDPRPQVRMTALANVRRKKVSILKPCSTALHT